MDSIQKNSSNRKGLSSGIWKTILILLLFIPIGIVTYNKFIWKPTQPSEARNAVELWSFLPGAPEENTNPWISVLMEVTTNERFFDQFSQVENLFNQAFMRLKNKVAPNDSKATTVMRFFPILIATSSGMLDCEINFKDRYLCERMKEIEPALNSISDMLITERDKGGDFGLRALFKLSNTEGMTIVHKFLEDYEAKVTGKKSGIN